MTTATANTIRQGTSTRNLVDQLEVVDRRIAHQKLLRDRAASILIERIGAGNTGFGTNTKVTVDAPKRSTADPATLKAASEEWHDKLTKVVWNASAYNVYKSLNAVPKEIDALVTMTEVKKSLTITRLKKG